MESSQYLAIARRWWWLLVGSALAGGIIAYAASGLIVPTYQATTTLRVIQQQTPGVIVRNDLETSMLLANTFSRMITIRPVLSQAIEQGGFDLSVSKLRASLSVRNPRATELLEVRATAGDPMLARDIANVVSEVFISSEGVQITISSDGITIIEPAVASRTPISPRKSLNAAIGGLLALVASTVLVLLFEYLDDTVKSAEHVSELTGLPTLGQLRRFGMTRSPSEQLQVAIHPHGPLSEDFRTARTNLANSLRRASGSGDVRKVVLFTSATRGEGKSTTVANLAVVLGDAGYRVAVVDADLREPSLHRIFSIDSGEGLTSVLLAGEGSAAQAMQTTSHTNVSLLPSGPIPPNPSELLGSARMREILGELREQFDIVILDSSPARVTDPSVLAAASDAIVIVARPNRTRTGELLAAIEELATSGIPIAGVVLNRVGGRGRPNQYGTYSSDRDARQGDATTAAAPTPFSEGAVDAPRKPAGNA